MANICKSRKSTTSIMNHGGYGALYVTKDGVRVEVPKNLLFEDGRIKKIGLKYINNKIKEANKMAKEEAVRDAC